MRISDQPDGHVDVTPDTDVAGDGAVRSCFGIVPGTILQRGKAGYACPALPVHRALPAQRLKGLMRVDGAGCPLALDQVGVGQRKMYRTASAPGRRMFRAISPQRWASG